MANEHPLESDGLRRVGGAARDKGSRCFALILSLATTICLIAACSPAAPEEPAAAEPDDADPGAALVASTQAAIAWYSENGEVEKSLALRETLVRLQRDLGFVHDSTKSAYRFVVQLNQIGASARVERYLDEVIPLTDRDDPVYPYLLAARADVARVFSDLPTANRFLGEALELVPEDSEIGRYLRTVNAQAYLDRGLPDLAAPIIDELLAAARAEGRAGDPGNLLAAVQVRANLLLATARYDRLLTEMTEALVELDAHPDPNGRVPAERLPILHRLALARLSRVAEEPEQAGLARKEFEELLAEQEHYGADTLATHTRLGQLALLTGENGLARTHLAAARALLAVEDADYAVRSRALVTALELQLALREGDEMSRAEAVESLTLEVDELRRSLLAQKPSVAGLGFLRYDRTRLLVESLLRGLMAAPKEGGARRALDYLARLQEVGSLYRRLTDSAPRAHWTTSYLDSLEPGHGVLVYLPLPHEGLVFAADASGVIASDLPSSVTVEKPLAAWAAHIEESPFHLIEAGDEEGLARRAAELAAYGERVANYLLPVAIRDRVATWDKVDIVGSEYFSGLAFEALPMKSVDDADVTVKMGDELDIAYLPSLSVASALQAGAQERQTHQETQALILAGIDVPVASDDWATGLLAGLDELVLDGPRAISFTAAFGGDLRLLTGRAANLDSLRRQLTAPTRLLHIATHGLLDTSRVRPRGLLLGAEEGQSPFLWCEEVETLVAPPLVILSACGAGRAPLRDGESTAASLGGAFLIAGADAVVLSSSDLAYDATLEFMSHVHRALEDGSSPAAALRAARVAMRASERWSDPHYHSLIRVVGLGHR